MTRIFITGATGNVGSEVIRALMPLAQKVRVVAGVRDLARDPKQISEKGVEFKHFDFEDAATFLPALSACDLLFLVRPPQLSDVEKYFVPLIAAAKKSAVQHIVFLSVQGVESSTLIPHHKIERLIVKSGLVYTFLRPAYFMQNLTTTLRADLIKHQRVFLPAGDARFTLIHTRDIGAVAAAILSNPAAHQNRAYDLTAEDRLTFAEMTHRISAGIGRNIRYISPSLVRFFIEKRREGVPPGFILVMIMLHYLPRFQKEAPITATVEQLTGRKPVSFNEFVAENTELLAGR